MRGDDGDGIGFRCVGRGGNMSDDRVLTPWMLEFRHFDSRVLSCVLKNAKSMNRISTLYDPYT